MAATEFRSRWFSWHLTKYIAHDVVVSFAMGTIVFLLIMLMFQAIRLGEFIIMHQVSFFNVLKLSSSLMLSFLPIALPVAFLFSVLMGISRANSEGEILALQVTGISIRQIFTPLLGFSILLTLLCIYTALYTVPQGNRSFELLITKIGSERVLANFKPGVFMEGIPGLVLYAEEVSPIRKEMKRVFIYDDRDPKHPMSITAQAGRLNTDLERRLMTLRLSDGTIYVEKPEAEGLQQKVNFDLYDINMEFDPGGKGWRDYSPPSLNYDQLVERMNAVKGKDAREFLRLSVEYHRRFSLSFSCIVFAALGFFIALLAKKGVRSTAIIICLLVGTVYWLSYVAANAWALDGSVSPWLGIWAPNFLFLLVPLYAYRKYRQG